MRFKIVGLLALAALAIIATPRNEQIAVSLASAPVVQPNPCPGLFKQTTHRKYVRAVYRRKHVSDKARQRIRLMQTCAKSDKARKNMYGTLYGARQARKARARIQRRIDACTPFGRWAIPAYIVMRESRGSRYAKNPTSTAGGYYQIIDSTWWSQGGKRYAVRHPAAAAPPDEQHCVAHRLWKSQGSSPWAATR